MTRYSTSGLNPSLASKFSSGGPLNLTNKSSTGNSGITSNASSASLLSLDEPENNIYIAFGLQNLKLKNGGTSTVRAPSVLPFDFDIKPSKNEEQDNSTINEELTIKIKLRSKLNPNFIRILGRVDLNLHKLVNKEIK